MRQQDKPLPEPIYSDYSEKNVSAETFSTEQEMVEAEIVETANFSQKRADAMSARAFVSKCRTTAMFSTIVSTLRG